LPWLPIKIIFGSLVIMCVFILKIIFKHAKHAENKIVKSANKKIILNIFDFLFEWLFCLTNNFNIKIHQNPGTSEF
jgi:hypothetical protein